MKLAGLLILALVPTVFCFALGEEVRRKEKRRKAFLELLNRMHFQIENFSRDQGEIFKGFHNVVLEETDFYNDLLHRVAVSPGGAFGSAWKHHGTDFSFDAQTKEVLDRFAEHFGLQEKSAQLQELGHVEELLESSLKKSAEESKNKIKILRISGLTAGLGILILLI